jgi:RNA polymerase sigma-70 factor (ECF subfamily)
MNKKAHVISQHIVDSFLQGDKSAFVTIYERLKGEIYMFTFKIVRSRPDAEDITATVFEKLWMFRPKLESPAHLKNWLFVTARNKCLNTLRDNQLTYELNEETVNSSETVLDVTPLQREQIWASLIERLWETISKLPPVRRKVMQMRFGENRSVDEIATTLGLSPQTVRNHLSRGKNQMQDLFIKRPFNETDLFLLLLTLNSLKLHETFL